MRILGLKWVAGILYPDVYTWDMEQECREFFHLFLQQDITAEEARRLVSAPK